MSATECRLVQPAGGESVGVAPHRRCTVRNGAGLRPTLKVKVWAAQPAPRASVRCPLPPSVVWVVLRSRVRLCDQAARHGGMRLRLHAPAVLLSLPCVKALVLTHVHHAPSCSTRVKN